MNLPSDDRFYDKHRLLRAFGISSILMLIFTIWMVFDDFGRDWKAYQARFFELRQKKYDEWIKKAQEAIDPAELKALEESLAKAVTDGGAHRKELERINVGMVALTTKEKLATVKFRTRKAVWDVEKYEYEAKYGHKAAEGHEDHGPAARAAFDKLQRNLAETNRLRDIANAFTQAIEDEQKKSVALMAEKAKADKDLKAKRADLDRLRAGKAATELTLDRLFRSAPIVDMANPTFRIQQVVLPTIRDDIFFAQVQKVDRCTTCHMAIDLPGFENEAQPFRTHPNLDLMLSGKSPHPMDKVGCTVCHEGRGQAMDFTRTAHTPRNKEQEKEWTKKYGWHSMHHVIEKMIPLQYTEGKCRTCHRQTEYVPHAEKLTAANQLVRSAGCYGCHRIEGWDHMRKPAPSLKRVKGKLSRDWIVKWLRNPRGFNENTRMPSPFFQSNITSDEFKAFQEAEIFAATDFLLGASEDYAPNHAVPAGNAEAGKALFGKVGCLGCHSLADYGVKNRFGQAPNLDTVGSKVTAPWLSSWLKNPRHYWAGTTMPSLRLSDREIGDLTAYLMSKKNPQFEAAEVGSTDTDTQKKVLRLYMMRDPKLAPVTSEKVDGILAALSSHDTVQRLGQNAVMRYGCFGCHEIKGMEAMPGIGAELTEEGSKPVGKLDFGLLHFEHSNYAWFHKKLENTRMFDAGIVKEYLDLLRMPNYGFSEDERNKLVTFLLGLTSLQVAPPAAKQLSAREQLAEEGMRLVHQYNCQGCHVVEQLWTQLGDDDPKKEEHEKSRFDLEGRILSHYQEDESLGPPPLVTQGSRTHGQWLYHFLENPGRAKLRTRLDVRMPTFQLSNTELNRIVAGWSEKAGVKDFPYVDNKPVRLSAADFAVAGQLFTKLQCLNCHTAGTTPTREEMEGGSKGLAPDLLHTHQRLRRDWIVELLKDPQKMVPGTRMPGFWPEGNSPAPELAGGDSQKQMELVADYVIYLGQSKGYRSLREPGSPAAEPAKTAEKGKRRRRAE